MSQPLVGPLPYPHLPEQPVFPSWCTAWGAYDVPRIWDIVRTENDHLGWEQVNGFRQLSDLLVDQYRRLRAQWANLSDAWQGTAANVYLSRLDAFSLALLSDAHCSATTANALHDIMSTYADARTKIDRLTDRWESVTSDWIPEWWDEAAAELNTEAAQVMFRTDLAVRDHRSRIIIPAKSDDQRDNSLPLPNFVDSESDGGGAINSIPVPPVPGLTPIVDLGRQDGPRLAGTPVPIIAQPGQPVSMLPIPPGSQYSPRGGAYILPGPGVGPDGHMIPMPGRGESMSAGTSNAGIPGTGILPVATSTPPANTKQGTGPLYRRSANHVWRMDKGVPPVIDAVGHDALIPNRPSQQQEEAFREWFAELAYPWRGGSNTSEPHVILRRVPS